MIRSDAILLQACKSLLTRANAAAGPCLGACPTSSLLLTLAMPAAFALLVPVLGFSPTCFLFVAAQLRVLGGWSWWLSLAVAAPIALAFHAAFITLADMPLPKGYFGI